MLTGVSLCDRLPGAESGPDGGQHRPVEGAGPQEVEGGAGGVRRHALVLDYAAVADQQNAVRVQNSGGSLPAGLQAVGAALNPQQQPRDLGRT